MADLPSSTALSDLVAPRRDWVVVGVALALGLCAFGLIFHAEIAMAVFTWANSDAYNHCFLVIPVAIYLAWERRQTIAGVRPQPAPWIALLALPAAAAWFGADRLGIMEARQLVVMALCQVMVAAVIGLAAWRALATPLLYLFFLVPFGEFLVSPLQKLVVHFTVAGLTVVGVPTYSNGIVIQIPEGTFLVHTACSGLRFLIASTAFGVLYACVMYTSALRRLIFSLVAIGIAVVANCFRVLGTILIAHFWGNVQAVEADHVIWGWGFYVIVGAILIAVGFAFRQEQAPVRIAPASAGLGVAPAMIALATVILLASAPRVAADYQDRLDVLGGAVQIGKLPAVPGCAGPAMAAAPVAAGAAAASRSGVYQCGGNSFEAALYRYPPRIGVRPLFASLQAVALPPNAVDTELQIGGVQFRDDRAGPVWTITEAATNDGRFVAAASALWLGGRPSAGGIAARVDQALNSVRRAPDSPVYLVITHLAQGGPIEARRALDDFLPKAAVFSGSVRQSLAQPSAR
jgi:exosortase A